MGDNFRQWLAGELEKQGWSQGELSRRSGVAQVTISYVLTGNRNPGADFCVKVAQALGEPPEKLLRLAGILPASNDSSLAELTDIIKNLSPNAQKEVLDFARFKLRQDK